MFDRALAVREYVMKGIPEINVPQLDPFILPYAKINQDLNEMVKIHSDIKNVKITGMKDAVLQYLK